MASNGNAARLGPGGNVPSYRAVVKIRAAQFTLEQCTAQSVGSSRFLNDRCDELVKPNNKLKGYQR